MAKERQDLLKADIQNTSKAVITGSLCGWGDIFIKYFDLVIYIYTPTNIRINRINNREQKRFGDRIIKGGDMYNTHLEFIEWAKTYDTAGTETRSSALHMGWLKGITCPVINVDGTKTVDELINELSCFMQK